MDIPMPTENRSSNTEMVSELLPCPFCKAAMSIESNRDWHRLMGDHDDECVFTDPETMTVPATDEQRAILVNDWNRRAQPAEQHQGEPVGIMRESSQAGVAPFADIWSWPEPGTKLYTHADPGEVERLRSELAQCEAMAAMIAEREWAEHAGTGPVSSKIEAAFTQLHNDLHEAGEKLAERDALLQRMKSLFRTDDPFDLYDAVCSVLAGKS